MQRAEQAASMAFFSLAVYVLAESQNLSYLASLGPGPGFFPFWLGACMAVLSLGWLAQCTFRPSASAGSDPLPGRAGLLRVAAILIALVLVAALMDLLGFQVVIFAFLLFTLTMLGRQNPVLMLLLALIGSVGVYYAFNTWLEVHLPESSIDFLRNLGL